MPAGWFLPPILLISLGTTRVRSVASHCACGPHRCAYGFSNAGAIAQCYCCFGPGASAAGATMVARAISSTAAALSWGSFSTMAASTKVANA